jgi:hypothetical protein
MRQRDRVDRLGQDKSASSSSIEKSADASYPLAQDVVVSKAAAKIDQTGGAAPTTVRNPKGNFKENVKTISSRDTAITDDYDDEEEGASNGTGFKHSENDQAALAAQGEFEVELTAWVNARVHAQQQQTAAKPREEAPTSAAATAPSSEKDKGEATASKAVADAVSAEPAHRREAFASYLSARYLCSRLDPLEKSPVVTSVRRRVARATDDLAAGRNPLLAARAIGAVPTTTSAAATSKVSMGSSSGSSQSDNYAWLRGPNKQSSQRHSAASETTPGPSASSSSSSVVAEIAAMHRAEAAKQAVVPSEQRGLVKHQGGLKGKGKAHWCTVRDGDWTCGKTFQCDVKALDLVLFLQVVVVAISNAFLVLLIAALSSHFCFHSVFLMRNRHLLQAQLRGRRPLFGVCTRQAPPCAAAQATSRCARACACHV